MRVTKDHAVEYDRGPIHNRELPVSGREPPPLLHAAVTALDYVPAAMLLPSGASRAYSTSVRAGFGALADLVVRERPLRSG